MCKPIAHNRYVSLQPYRFDSDFLCRLVRRTCRIVVVFLLFAVPLFFLTRASAPAYAATSSTLNFQARLETGGGAIAPDGYYNVQFKLYNASTGGTALWTETYGYNGGAPDQRVRVANGYLTVNLGSITAFPSTIPWDQQLYVTMNIGGTGTTASWDGEMSPRLSLTAVPYAFNAQSASQLVTTSGSLSSTLSIQAPTVGNQIFQIQDQGAAGTYNLLTAPVGSDGYVKLQAATPTTQQTGGLWVSGTARVDTALQAPLLDTATAGTLSIGTGNATGINIGNTTSNIATTITGTTLIKPTTGNDSSTAFQVQNAAGTTLLGVDTTNAKIILGAAGTYSNVNVLTDSMTTTPSGTLLGVATYVSGSYVELTHNVSSTNGEIEYTPTVSSNFESDFQFYISGAADAVYWYGAATSTPTTNTTADGGYTVYFDEWQNQIGLEFNGTLLKSVSQSGLNNAAWRSVKIRKLGTNIQVSLDGTVVINYNDTSRTLSGTKWGLGAFSGGSGAYQRVKALTIDNLVTSAINASTLLNGTLNIQTYQANSTSALTVSDMNGVNYLGVDTINGYITTSRSDGHGFVFSTPSMSSGSMIEALNNGTSKFAVNYAGLIQGSGIDTLSGGTLYVAQTNATGGINLGQNTTLAAGKSFTYASGAGNFDQSASTGTFKTGTGAVSLNGNTTIASGMTLSVQGVATFQNTANSTGAFNVNNTSGISVLKVDTSNTRVAINNASPAASLDVVGTGPAYVNGFESGVLSPFTTSDTTKWNVANTTRAHTGSYVLEGNPTGSATAGVNYTTSLTETLNASGTISFWTMCDWSNASAISFAIDGGAWNNLMSSACVSGTNNSTTYNFSSFGVAAGAHTFTWEYNVGSFPSTFRFYIDDLTITNVGTLGAAAIFNNGGVGIDLGTGIQPAVALDVNGAIQGTSSLTLGTSSSTNGTIVLRNSTNANTVTIQSAAQTGNYTLTIPVLSANDTLMTNTTGIQNQNASSQTANYWISGTGRADTAIVTPVLRPTADSTSAIQMQNAAGTGTIMNVDTTNSTVTFTAGSSSAALSAEMYSGNFGSGWTATGWDVTTDPTKAKHTTGNTNALVYNTLSVTAGTTYLVHFYLGDSSAYPTPCGGNGDTLSATIGGATLASGMSSCYKGYDFVATATTTGSLTFTPTSGWVGPLMSISIKTLSGQASSAVTVQNSASQANIEVRANSDTSNTFIGLNSGKQASSAYSDTAVGSGALQGEFEGGENTAIGYSVLKSNGSGTDNTGTGANALQNNTAGSYNSAFGPYALSSNTIGDSNTAIGNSSLTNNTTGSSNTSLGDSGLSGNTTGSNNVAIGAASMQGNTTGSNNVSVGNSTLNNNTTGTGNTALGYYAGYQDSGAVFQTLATLQNSTALGIYAQVTQNNSIVLGSVDQGTQVGIGITSPQNLFSVSPVDYNGTVKATQSGSTVTAQSSVFTSAMVGETLVWADDGTTATITAYTDATHVTVSTSVTKSTATSFRIHKVGLQVATSGNVGIGTVSPQAALDVNGSIQGTSFVLKNSTNTNTVSLLSGAQTGNYTLTIPVLSANDTICTVGLVNCGGGGGGSISLGTYSTTNTDAHGATLSAGVLTFQDASTSAPGMMGTGAQTFAGNKTFNGNVIMSATSTLNFTGNTTANRPASPTEGMLYYDTTTKQLLVYANGKWQADGKGAIIVAASNSTDADKGAADYVATGSGDQTTINNALTAADPAGTGRKTGRVVLLGGTYTINGSISVPNNTTLSGVGSATVITIPNAFNTSINAITNTTTGGSGTGVVVRDLKIDGNKANQTSGSMVGIYLNGVGSGSGSSAVTGAVISNVQVINWNNAGLQLASSSKNSQITHNTIETNGSDGIDDISGSNNIITGNTSLGNSSIGIYTFTAFNDIISQNVSQGNATDGIRVQDSNSITVAGNTTQGNTSNGIEVNSQNSTTNTNTITANTSFGNGGNGIQVDFKSNVTSNTVKANTGNGIVIEGDHNNIASNSVIGNNYGIYIYYAGNNAVSSNSIYDNGGSTANNGIYLISSSNNTITGNTITDTSCTTTCYAINISDSSSASNYLSANIFTGDGTYAATINDAGSLTTYAGQSVTQGGTDARFRQANSTSAFSIQNANGVNVLAADTSNGLLQIGNYNGGTNPVAGKLVIANATNANTVTITSNAPTGGSYTLTIPTLTANDTICTLGTGCGSSGANTSLSNLTATNINQALNATSGNLTLQTTTSGNIILAPAGTINLNGATNITGTTSINTSGTANTSIGNGSTGTITIGNGSTGAITLQSGTSIGLTGTTSITGATSINTSGTANTSIGNGSTGTITIGNSGTGAIGLQSGSNISFVTNTNTTGVSIQSATNSTVAFQVQNNLAKAVFGVDTSAGKAILGTAGSVGGALQINAATSGNVTISIPTNTTSYNLVLPSSAGATNNCLLNGGTPGSLVWGSCVIAGSTRTVTLVPEFAGGILHADGTNNSGTMTSDMVNGLTSAQGYKHNFYEWTTSNSTAQHYDIVVNTALPSEYTGSLGGLKIWVYSSDTTNATGTIQFQDATGTSCYASPVSITPSAATTWQQISVGAMSGCTFAANDVVTITIHMVATSGAIFEIGEVSYTYSN